jgi:hypothetical protein
MSCASGRCALRRFDGHGTPYKATNTAASKQVADSLARMMAERELQDAGIYQQHSKNVVLETPVIALKQVQQSQLSQIQPQTTNNSNNNNTKFYNLSD